jgi:hypothetical protein
MLILSLLRTRIDWKKIDWKNIDWKKMPDWKRMTRPTQPA